MRHLCGKLRSRRGETLVELLVAFALLLLFVATFGGALRAAQGMQSRAETSREAAWRLIEPLRPVGAPCPGAADDGVRRYEFCGEDGQPAFTLELPCEAVTVSDGEETHTFRRFAAPADAGQADP